MALGKGFSHFFYFLVVLLLTCPVTQACNEKPPFQESAANERITTASVCSIALQDKFRPAL